jgi:hypothetical protein
MVGVFENDWGMIKKQNYSIIIIGINCHYGHLCRFVKFLRQTNPEVVITFFGDYDKTVQSPDIQENVDRIIYRHVFSLKYFRFLKYFFNIVILRKQFKILSKTERFDIINIHYPRPQMMFVRNYLRRMGKRIILTPWGSDVLRATKHDLFELKYIYRRADLVTVGAGSDIGRIAQNRFGIDKNRFEPLAWGSETIDFINDHLEHITKEEAKKRLNLSDSYVITCGYNAYKAQRHLAIIDAIVKVKSHLPENVVFLFPTTYATKVEKEEYVSLLKEKCKGLGLNAVFFENYLSVEDIFLLRRASDMFIHVQTTDAGNSTIMEYLICGNKVIHGSWMHYKWLDYPPKFYFPVDDLEDLPKVIVEAYQAEMPSIPEEVVTRIKNRGWKQKMIAWNETFISCVNEDS